MKNKILRSVLMVLIWTFASFTIISAQNSYRNFNELTERLDRLESNYGNLVFLQSLAKTAEGRDIWALTIGSGTNYTVTVDSEKGGLVSKRK